LQERSPAPGWPHRLAGGGSVVKLGADVPFEPSELVDQRGLVCADAVGCSLDGGEGHRDLEAPQPVPSLEAAFDGAADILGHIRTQLGDHLGEAVHARRAGGDAVTLGGAVDGHDGDTEFCGDVCVWTLPVPVLLTEPVLVNVCWRG